MRTAGKLRQDQVAGLICAMPQQRQHDVVRIPLGQIARRVDAGGHAPHEGTPQETLWALVVQEPWQPWEQAIGEVAMQECR